MEKGVTEITDIVFTEKKEEEEKEEKDEKEGEKKNGIINSLISNLSPRVVVAKDGGGDDSHSTSPDHEAKNGGGVFHALISGILHPADREGAAASAADDGEGTAAADGAGALLDTAPAADEASILIHSLVHD